MAPKTDGFLRNEIAQGEVVVITGKQERAVDGGVIIDVEIDGSGVGSA